MIRQKIKQYLLVGTVSLIIAIAPTAAIAVITPPPAIPLYIYGVVKIDNNLAPAGTEVSVENNATEILRTTVNAQGYYFLEVPAENSGNTLTYKVNGIVAAQKLCPDPMSVPSEKIDLSITTAEPTSYCGDGVCDGDETCSTCSTDCGSCGGGGGAGAGGGGGNQPSNLTNLSVLINNGQATTSERQVSLSLSVDGASEMMISNSADFMNSNWEQYASTKEWVLDSGLGEKTVYVKFKNATGNISTVVSDSILLVEEADQPVNQANKEPSNNNQNDGQKEDGNVKVLGVEADWRTIQLQQILADAKIVYQGDAGLICGQTGVKRDPNKEGEGYNKYTRPLIADNQNLTESNIYAITNFIVYGTKSTLVLGAGERAGVINSYKSAFNKLPKTESEWQDVIKIANGRWPNERSAAAEERAKSHFQTIYLRQPNMNQPNDNAAVTIMAYGLRPADRNLNSEKMAIVFFRGIYGHNPSSAVDWDIVRAIAYSGAVR